MSKSQKENNLQPLADQGHRDAILSHNGHIFVLAGAGTGKSTIIAKKIIELIKFNRISSLTQIAAITYTNKAASELKWKIENHLKTELSASVEGPVKEKFKKAIGEIQKSSFGTIHSFCAEILRKYGFLFGIDPVFSILSKNENHLLLEDSLQTYLREIESGHGNLELIHIWKQIFKYTGKYNLAIFSEQFKKFEDKFHFFKKLDNKNFLIHNEEELTEYKNNLFDEYRSFFLKTISYYDFESESAEGEKSLGYKIVNLRDILLSSNNHSQIYREFLFGIHKYHPQLARGKKKYFMGNSPYEDPTKIIKNLMKIILSFGDPTIEIKIPEDMKNLDEFHSKTVMGHSFLTYSSCIHEYLRYLWFFSIRDFASFYENKKAQSSVMSYGDIIHYALEILRNQEILEEIQHKYKYIFVDEYQDTDPVQTEIFTLISGIYSKGTNVSSLIRVGDAKQSIYGFRGADLKTFYEEKDKFLSENKGHIGNLQVNMRSHPQILGFVNQLFSASEYFTKMDIPGYESLLPGNLNEKIINPGVYCSFFNDEENSKVLPQRESEAHMIAREISYIQKEHPELTIALLFRNLTDNIEPYVKLFQEKNLPFHLIGRRFYGENFTQKYLSLLLNSLKDPLDQVSITGFLRSPICGFTDKEVDLVLRDKWLVFEDKFILNPENKDEPLFLERLEGILNILNTAFEIGSSKSLAYMIYYIFHSAWFIEFTLKLKNSQRILDSLDRIYEIACEFDNLHFSSFKEKIDFFCLEIEKLENIPDFDEGGESFDSENKIQIMSYHKSKGLEFDIVFLPDLVHSSQRPSDTILCDNTKNEFLFHYKNDFSFYQKGKISTAEYIQEKSESEMIRLLYVAMTRAKQRLYLPIHVAFRSGAILSFLMDGLLKKFPIEPEKRLSSNWEKVGYKTDEDFYIFVNDGINVTDENISFSYEEKEFHETSEFQKVIMPGYHFSSPTSIMKSLEEDDAYDRIRIEPEINISKNQDYLVPKKDLLKDPVSRGILTHSFFELLDLKNPEIHESLYNSITYSYSPFIVKEHNLLKYLNEVLKAYKGSELFSLIQKANTICREVAFSNMREDDPLKKSIIIGYIDLMLEVEDSIYIIDYKTNYKDKSLGIDEFGSSLKKKYLVPMSLYKKSVQTEFLNKTVKGALYHTDTGTVFAYDSDEWLDI